MQPSVSRVLKAFAAPFSLRETEQDLRKLEELEQELEFQEGIFQSHYASGTDIPEPDIRSYQEAYRKAYYAEMNAERIVVGLQNELSLKPNDRALQSALKKADALHEKLKKHLAKAEVIRSTLTKKVTPPALRSMANKVAKLVQDALVDPKLLTLSYEADEGDIVPMIGSRGSEYYGKGMRFTVRFVFEAIEYHYDTRLVEYPTGIPGVFILNGSYKEKLKPEVAVKKILDDLKEHRPELLKIATGAPGEGTAGKIKSVLQATAARFGMAVDEAEISSDGKHISVTFRTEINMDRVSEADESDLLDLAHLKYLPKFKSAISEFMSEIKSTSLNYEEKGWWTFSVELK